MLTTITTRHVHHASATAGLGRLSLPSLPIPPPPFPTPSQGTLALTPQFQQLQFSVQLSPLIPAVWNAHSTSAVQRRSGESCVRRQELMPLGGSLNGSPAAAWYGTFGIQTNTSTHEPVQHAPLTN